MNGELDLRLPDRAELHGKTFDDLQPKLQTRIEDCNLIYYVVESKVPERARLDICERVNGGGNAWFSDSSETEKSDSRDQLTFQHPDQPRRSLFCPWHGKIRYLELHLHYTWSGRAGEPACVVYLGPKITKR